MDGCAKPHFAKGYCNAHYSRWRRHGDPLIVGGTPKNEAANYYRQVVLNYEGDDCLIWPYATGGEGRGYPKLGIGHVPRSVHRMVCVHVNGDPPSDVHQAAHNCGDSLCVNPRHIRWATPLENMADTLKHGTRANMGAGPRRRKLLNAQARENGVDIGAKSE